MTRTKKGKSTVISFQIKEEEKEDFKSLCESKGISMSTALVNFIMRCLEQPHLLLGGEVIGRVSEDSSLHLKVDQLFSQLERLERNDQILTAMLEERAQLEPEEIEFHEEKAALKKIDYHLITSQRKLCDYLQEQKFSAVRIAQFLIYLADEGKIEKHKRFRDEIKWLGEI